MRAARRARAQSVAEFAIALPLFLLLLFGMIDFSRLLFTYVSLTNGTRELARLAALSTSSDMTAPVNAFNNLTIIGGPASYPGDNNQVKITWVSSCNAQPGASGCPSSGASKTTTCPLPLSVATCSPAPPLDRSVYYDGYVEVTTTYTFHFSPLFDSSLGHIGFMRQLTTLSTTTQATVE